MIDYFHNEVFKSGYVWVDQSSGFELSKPRMSSSAFIDKETGERRIKRSEISTSPWLIPVAHLPSDDESTRTDEMIRYSLPLYRPYPRRGEANGEVPLKAPQPLVRKFTALEAGTTDDEDVQKESILSFANEHGLLGEQVELVGPDKNLVPCDTLGFWINQIHNVYRDLRLWDLLCIEIWEKQGGIGNPYRPNDEPTELRQLFDTSDERALYMWRGYKRGVELRLVISSIKNPDLLPLWQQTQDLIMAARVALAISLDENLVKFTCGKVLFDTYGKKDLMLRVVPNSLVGAIWWELARLVTGELRFKQCEVCGQWEDLTGRRADWRMHSKCRKLKNWEKRRSSRSIRSH